MVKLKLNNIIERFMMTHGDKYNYSKVMYFGMLVNVDIECPKHGVFSQTPNKHIRGSGCSKCVYESRRISINDFITRANFIHNNKYNYSLVNFFVVSDEIKIICPTHGVFTQLVNNHLNKKYGCIKCANNEKRINWKYFLEKAKYIHNDKYEYIRFDSCNNKTKIEISCRVHGYFKQSILNHLAGNGCKYCKSSKGENVIRQFLIENNIKYKQEKTFPECVYVRRLKFDFYLEDYNVCIEYDGSHHFKAIDWFGGDEAFEIIKIRDNIKTDFCIKNNIKLIRLNYLQFDNICPILKAEFKHFS